MSQIEVRILQQEYVLTCPDGQEAMLQAAVERVDSDMERIRNTGKVRARERVGVLASVNLAFENATLAARNQQLERELDLTLESEHPTHSASEADSSTAHEMQALAAELQSLLSLREQELEQAQHLIERLEAALETDSKLL